LIAVGFSVVEIAKKAEIVEKINGSFQIDSSNSKQLYPSTGKSIIRELKNHLYNTLLTRITF